MIQIIEGGRQAVSDVASRLGDPISEKTNRFFSLVISVSSYDEIFQSRSLDHLWTRDRIVDETITRSVNAFIRRNWRDNRFGGMTITLRADSRETKRIYLQQEERLHRSDAARIKLTSRP